MATQVYPFKIRIQLVETWRVNNSMQVLRHTSHCLQSLSADDTEVSSGIHTTMLTGPGHKCCHRDVKKVHVLLCVAMVICHPSQWFGAIKATSHIWTVILLVIIVSVPREPLLVECDHDLRAPDIGMAGWHQVSLVTVLPAQEKKVAPL